MGMYKNNFLFNKGIFCIGMYKNKNRFNKIIFLHGNV